MSNLKLFFAFSDGRIDDEAYMDMLEVSLKTARNNTTLNVHALYDGQEGDAAYQMLEKYGVTIHKAEIPFQKELYATYMKKEGMIVEKLMRGVFLRLCVPQFAKDDDYVLYCDTDMMFLKDIKLEDLKKLPKYVGVVSEFDCSDKIKHFNSGVMLINVKNFESKYQEFLQMLKDDYRPRIDSLDQGYLNDLFKDDFEVLPLEMNWKTYWGINDNAKIVHLHEPKPRLAPICKKFDYVVNAIHAKEESINGMYYYLSMYADILGRNKDLILDNLTKVILCNLNCSHPKMGFFNKRDVLNRFKTLHIICAILLVLAILGIIF